MSFFKNIFGKGPSFELEDDKEVHSKNLSTSSPSNDVTPKTPEKETNEHNPNEDVKYGVSDKYASAVQEDICLYNDELDFYTRKKIKIYDPSTGKNIPKYVSKFERPPVYEKCSVIILAVENSQSVNAYQNRVLSVINKIISDNKSDLFMFFKLTKSCSNCELMSYSNLENADIASLLFDKETMVDFVDMSNTMKQIYEYVSKNLKTRIVEHCDKKYQIQAVRILFVGTGLMDEEPNTILPTTHFLSCLKRCDLIKSIKYFCIKDKDAISVAKMGFPIIGHLESNFYK